MSQGDRLVRALQRIGCPAAKDHTGESLEWMFENDCCLSFLEWFIDCIESDAGENVLTDDELQRYSEMVSSGEGIIEVYDDNDGNKYYFPIKAANTYIKRQSLDECSIQMEIN